MPDIQNRFHTSLLLATLLYFAAASVHADTFRVGTDAACTHSTIQSAIDAAAGNGPDIDFIRIARSASYTGQALQVKDHSVSLQGSFATCNGEPTSTPTTLSGAGNGGLPILRVLGTSDTHMQVAIRDFDLVDGGGPGADGGGIHASGHASVLLYGIRVRANQGAHGGGIYVAGRDAAHTALVTLAYSTSTARHSSLETNTATAGGGAYVDHDAQLGAPSSPIVDNSADYGGGLHVAPGGSASLRVSTDGVLPMPADAGLRRNRARLDGGGYYSTGKHASFNESNPVPYPIVANRAGRNGGGVFVGGDASTSLTLRTSYIEGNLAGADGEGCGGGLYAENGASLSLLGIADAFLRCPAEAPCARLRDNRAGNSDNSGTGGGACARGGSRIRLHGVEASGNRAAQGAAVFAEDTHSQVVLDSVLLIESEGAGSTIVLRDEAQGSASGITLTDDLTGGPLIQLSNAGIGLDYSILYQPGRSVLQGGGTNARCVLSHEVFFPVGDIRVGDPRFVDAAAGDYRLAPDSPAVDACEDIAASDRDLASQPRGIDWPNIENVGGAHDLGALERQIPLEIFVDDFESE